MSVHYLSSVLESLVGASFRPSRDGVLVNTPKRGTYDFVTRYLDEPAVLAAVDALAAALRARGVVAATNTAADDSLAVAAPFSSAFAVSDTPPPADMVIRGGKVETMPTHPPSVAAPPAAPVAAVADVPAADDSPVAAVAAEGVKRRRGKVAK